MKKTRVLLVSGDDDFAALKFENEHGGAKVKDIIDNLDKYVSPDEEWKLEVFEFGDIDPKFAKFVREHIQDYDDSKNKEFYLEEGCIGH